MEDDAYTELAAHKRTPWNKGKRTGAKPPLRQKHVWGIRTKLRIDQRIRDLALFNLAIDSKLRGCDVVAHRSLMTHSRHHKWYRSAAIGVEALLESHTDCPLPGATASRL